MSRSMARIPLMVSMMLLGAFAVLRAQAPPAAQDPGQSQEAGRERRQMRGNVVVGRIESVSATELKLSAPDGSTVTVALSSNTQFRIEQQPAKPEDFKVGTSVFVRRTKSGDSTWAAELVAVRNGPLPFGQGPGGGQKPGGNLIVGTVQSIEGTKINVARLEGNSQTIEVDENTSFQKHRESITLADIHTGDAIAIRGEAKDGVFVPKTINVVDPAQLERIKQFLNSEGAPPGGTTPTGDKKPGPDGKPQGPH